MARMEQGKKLNNRRAVVATLLLAALLIAACGTQSGSTQAPVPEEKTEIIEESKEQSGETEESKVLSEDTEESKVLSEDVEEGEESSALTEGGDEIEAEESAGKSDDTEEASPQAAAPGAGASAEGDPIQDYLDKIHNDEVILTDGYTAGTYSEEIEISNAHPTFKVVDVNHDGLQELFVSLAGQDDYCTLYYVKNGEIVEMFDYIIEGTFANGDLSASERFDQWAGRLVWNGEDWVEGERLTYEQRMEEAEPFTGMLDL